MSAVVYLNGEFVPLDRACVPVLDRGFLLGDGVYEVIPAYGGNLFRLGQHLARLQRSLDEVRIPAPLGPEEWSAVLTALLERNGSSTDQSVYLQVTRGVGQKRDHAFPATVRPTVFAMASPLTGADPEAIEAGVSAITRDDIRWARCDIKATTLLANVLLRQQALDSGAAEAILVRDGYATEGAASNLFAVLDGVITTPPKSAELLPGITRDLVLELADEHGLAYREARLRASDLYRTDEIWLTSSTREILPVTRLDDRAVGSARPGPVWRRMRDLYQGYKQALRRGTAPEGPMN